MGALHFFLGDGAAIHVIAGIPAVGANGQVQRPSAAAAPLPATTARPNFVSNGKYRSDGKCGPLNLLESGEAAECDPNSEYWCCSEHGFCGGTQEHCYCDTCINYRPIKVTGRQTVEPRRSLTLL